MDCDEESSATLQSTAPPTVETDTVDINSGVETCATLDNTVSNTTAGISTPSNDSQQTMMLEESPMLEHGGYLVVETKNEQSMYCKDIVDSSAVAGNCGLFNLGNTCFMNAGIQSLVSNMDLMEYFLENFQPLRTDMDTLTDRFCHFVRKLWSGRYSIVHPLDFKQQLGMYHPQFRDYRQHDCQEFLAVLLDSLHEQLNVVNRSTQQMLTHESDAATSADKESIQAQTSDLEENNKKFTSSFKPIGKVKGPSNTVENNLHSNLTSSLACEGKLHIPVSLSANVEKSGAYGYSQVDHIHDDDLVAMQEHDRETAVSRQSSGNDSPPSMVNSKYKLLSDRMLPSNGACGSEPQIIANLLQNTHTKSRLGDVSVPNNVSASCLKNKKADIIKSDKNFQLNNATLKIKFPEIEQYYAKETKTLNVNMLVMDDSEESITTDSGKFSKRDEIRPLQDDLDTVHEAIPVESSKKDAFAGIKDVNLTTEQRGYSMKNNASTNPKVLEFDNNPGFNNNIKRMRTDENEKNIRQQKLSKVNTKKLFDDLTTGANAFSSRTLNDIPGSMDVASDSDEELDMEESEMSSADEDHDVSSRSSPVLESEVSLQCGDPCSPEDIATADKAWLEYLEQNRSIIVDTFHGQFKSTVICSDCSHVSVTFEPFMYLSLPIPHAMERQICILYLPLNNLPVKYLVTLNKNDMVSVLKHELMTLTGCQPGHIIMAEVLNCHISRILEDNIMVSYINDSSRDIYAFEIKPPPVINDDEQPTAKTELLNNEAHCAGPTYMVPQGTDLPVATVTTDRNNVFADLTTAPKTDNADTCAMNLSNSSEDAMSNIPKGTSRSNNSGGPYDIEETGLCASSTLSFGSSNNATETVTQHTVTAMNDNVDDLVAAISELSDDKLEETWKSNEKPGVTLGDLTPKAPVSTASLFSSMMPSSVGAPDFRQYTSFDADVNIDTVETGILSWADLSAPESTTTLWDVPTDATFSKTSPTNGITDKWQACAICLEELSDAELMIHVPCGGTFCPSCLEMSMKHYGSSAFTCPVCTAEVDPLVDFVPILNAANYKPKLRILSIPVAYRWRKADGDGQMELFGHPNIIYLSNNVTGQQIYDRLDELIPYDGEYTVNLTDGQGIRCSRCPYTDHCTGCEVRLDADVHFQPGDQLTVTMTNFTQDLCASAQDFCTHQSMENLRSTDPITLQDCFKTFMKSEFLDEQNPWYCPQCQKNQCAHKTMTVWRYPTTLIIHLKRFVFHDLSSSKVDCKVVFPLDILDLSECLSGPQITELDYTLQSAICHFGGVNSGHYTAFTQHPVSRRWSNYNDELVSEQIPRELDYSSAYILFYQQQGSNVPASLVKRFEQPTSCPGDNGRESQSNTEPNNALKNTVEEHPDDYTLDFYS